MKASKDANWLFKKLLIFFEDLPEKEKSRFANMKGEAFAHALMMCYGAYLLNQKKTGKFTIR